MRAALKTLLTRLPGIQLHPNRPPERNQSFFVNGFSVLPVAWDPAAVRPAANLPAAAATPS